MKLKESSGLKLADLLGVLDGFVVAAQLAVEDAQRGMAQGVIGVIGDQGRQFADRLLQLPCCCNSIASSYRWSTVGMENNSEDRWKRTVKPQFNGR